MYKTKLPCLLVGRPGRFLQQLHVFQQDLALWKLQRQEVRLLSVVLALACLVEASMLQAKVLFPITVKAMPPMHPDTRAAAAAQDLDRLAVVLSTQYPENRMHVMAVLGELTNRDSAVELTNVPRSDRISWKLHPCQMLGLSFMLGLYFTRISDQSAPKAWCPAK